MFYFILAIFIGVMLVVGLVHDRRRRRRGAANSTSSADLGPGAHGAQAEGIHGGMRVNTGNRFGPPGTGG